MTLSINPNDYYFALSEDNEGIGTVFIITPKEYWDTTNAWYDDGMPIAELLEEEGFYEFGESVFEADIGRKFENYAEAVERLLELGFEENIDLIEDQV